MIRSHPYASINWIRFIGLAPVPLVHPGTPLSSIEHPVEEVTLYYQQENQASTGAGRIVKTFQQSRDVYRLSQRRRAGRDFFENSMSR